MSSMVRPYTKRSSGLPIQSAGAPGRSSSFTSASLVNTTFSSGELMAKGTVMPFSTPWVKPSLFFISATMALTAAMVSPTASRAA